MMEGTAKGISGNLWKFRDGKEYLVSLDVTQTLPKSLSITLSDKSTAAEWNGQFDLKYIESLTHRTGNFKSFDTFVAMIKCAVLKKTEAVTLDLMSYDDLVALRDKKRRLGETTSSSIQNMNLGTNFSSDSINNNNNNEAVGRETEKIPKKYLIITYVAEFDKVHYPLKLNYMGLPDLSVMQETILKLKNELDHLRNTNRKLTDKLKVTPTNNHHHQSPTISHNNDEDAEVNCFVKSYDKNENPMEEEENDDDLILLSSNGIKSCKKSKTILFTTDDRNSESPNLKKLKQLEDQVQSERKANLYKMTKMKGENDYLRAKIKSIEVSESLLQQKVSRLESALALNLAIKKNENGSRHQFNKIDDHHHQPEETSLLQNNNDNISTSCKNYPIRGQHLSRPPGRRGFDNNTKNKDGDLIGGKPVSRNNSVTSCCSRCSSMGGGGGSENSSCWTKIRRPASTNNSNEFNKPAHTLLSRRSRSCEKRSAFNPTEYVTQKKMRQEMMDRMRIAKIESKIQRETQRRGNINSNNNNFCHDRKISTATGGTIPSDMNFHGGGFRKRSVSEQGMRRRLIDPTSRNTAQKHDSSMDHRSTVGSITTTSRRKPSPSPIRRVILAPTPDPTTGTGAGAARKKRLSRKPTKTVTTTTTRSTNDNFATIDLILNHVCKHCDEKEESKFQKRHHHTHHKKKLPESARPATTTTESNHSLGKLQRRLHTLHTFLGKTTTKSHGTKL